MNFSKSSLLILSVSMLLKVPSMLPHALLTYANAKRGAVASSSFSMMSDEFTSVVILAADVF